MKNFDFAPNVVRTSYRSSFFGDNYGSEFCFGPPFFVDEYSEFCLVNGASYLIRMLPFEQECRCCYEVICFHGISWLKSPFFSTGDSALASMPAFQPPFLRPSLPVGFLERLTYCLLTSSFAAASLDAILPSAAFLTTDSTYFAVQSLHADGLPLEC